MSNIKQFKKGTNTKLTNNFSSTEFDCNCKRPECQWTLIDMNHINRLQEKRDKLGKSIHINCGYRCAAHNAEVGGASQSQHMDGTATDIVVGGMTPDEVAKEMEDAFDGIGQYTTFTHVDSRGSKARWDFRKKE